VCERERERERERDKQFLHFAMQLCWKRLTIRPGADWTTKGPPGNSVRGTLIRWQSYSSATPSGSVSRTG